MPSKLPILFTIRGDRAYAKAVKDLADSLGIKAVADLFERSVAELASRQGVTLPRRSGRGVVRRVADPAPEPPPKKSRKKSGEGLDMV